MPAEPTPAPDSNCRMGVGRKVISLAIRGGSALSRRRRGVVSCACVTLLAVILMTACGSETLPTSPETDRAALTVLYETANGPKWLRNAHWLSDEPMGRWAGVTTDSDGRVVELDLFRNNLHGFIPPELGNLDKLVALDVANRRESKSAFANLVGSISDLTDSGQTNYVFGCVPSRLKGQLDMHRSFLGNLEFCDEAGEDEVNGLILEHAIDRGNIAQVQRLVRDGAASETTCPEALRQSVTAENAEVVRLLAEVCADHLNTVREDRIYDQTLLSLAVKLGNEDVARVLVEAGAKAGAQAYDMLLRAIHDGNPGMVAAIVEAGADVNARSEFGGPPLLDVATHSDNAEILQILIDAGAEK